MNIAKTWQTESSKQEDTFAIGEQFGRVCRGGEVLLLSSDLGGGKTTFTKGLAKGLGSKDTVTSPTFMVSRVYDCRNNIKLHHFDFYRLSEGGMVGMELEELLADPKAVTVIEWGDVVTDSLPLEHMAIKLERSAAGEDIRKITATVSNKYAYLLEGIA